MPDNLGEPRCSKGDRQGTSRPALSPNATPQHPKIEGHWLSNSPKQTYHLYFSSLSLKSIGPFSLVYDFLLLAPLLAISLILTLQYFLMSMQKSLNFCLIGDLLSTVLSVIVLLSPLCPSMKVSSRPWVTLLALISALGKNTGCLPHWCPFFSQSPPLFMSWKSCFYEK